MSSSAFTNEPIRPRGNDAALTAEYAFQLEDHLALTMFFYDKNRAESRRGTRFWLRRVFPVASIVSAYTYASTVGLLPERRWQSLLALGVLGCVVAIVLDTLWPGGLFSGIRRSYHQGRMMQLIRAGRSVGLYNPRQWNRVILSEEGFIEHNDLREHAEGVEIIEHKETHVSWSAVTDIDLTDEHAFFSVKDKGWLILPRHAFAEEADFLAFVETARRYRTKK